MANPPGADSVDEPSSTSHSLWRARQSCRAALGAANSRAEFRHRVVGRGFGFVDGLHQLAVTAFEGGENEGVPIGEVQMGRGGGSVMTGASRLETNKHADGLKLQSGRICVGVERSARGDCP